MRTSLRANGIGAKVGSRSSCQTGRQWRVRFILSRKRPTTPLNPNYREDEFAFYLEDLTAKAIVLEAGYSGPAEAAARRQGLAILRLQQDSTVAGKICPNRQKGMAMGDDNVPDQDDIALILHTSGTTSRPKIVPLLQSNVTASARNIAVSLNLTSSDRCLNVMPLFHIHGLIAAVASSLSVGASIWCTSGFNAMTFLQAWRRPNLGTQPYHHASGNPVPCRTQ